MEVWKNFIEHVQKKQINMWNSHYQCVELFKNFIVNFDDKFTSNYYFSGYPTSDEALVSGIEAL